MMQLVLLFSALVWLGGIFFLRIWVARIATRVGRGDFWELLRDIGWTIEGNQPWTRLGRLTLAWAGAGPLVIIALYLILFRFLRT